LVPGTSLVDVDPSRFYSIDSSCQYSPDPSVVIYKNIVSA